jgi:hypothetical protein
VTSAADSPHERDDKRRDILENEPVTSRDSKAETLPDASDAPEAPSKTQVERSRTNARATDVVLVHGVTADGAGLNVIRQRNQQLELGAIHPARSGRPIHGELVKLRPRSDCPLVYDVDVQYSPTDSEPRSSDTARAQSRSRRGPARVASDAYRTNWDAIWAHPPKGDLVN